MADPKPVDLTDVQHIRVAGGEKDTYCGHPLLGGLFHFGGGEMALIYYRAPCAYRQPADVGHDFHTMERSVQVLARSLDGGQTWADESVVWERGAPVDVLQRRLWPDDATREPWDMAQPGACFFFGRSWAGKVVHDPGRGPVPGMVSFALRSIDKGRTWERVPTLFAPPAHQQSVLVYGNPPTRLPDGCLLVAATTGHGADPTTHKETALYLSDDDGLSWEYITPIGHDPAGVWYYTYPTLVRLPDGRLQCVMMRQSGNSTLANWACLSTSDDGGLSWSAPRPIGQLGHSPWREHRQPGQHSRAALPRDPAGRPLPVYEPTTTRHALLRAPSALRLRDGRTLILYGRRKPPFGMGGLVSDDDGQTWSREFVLRADANYGDLGYQVAAELDDGRIFTAYYYTLDDGNGQGGTRFIAGTFFRLPRPGQP